MDYTCRTKTLQALVKAMDKGTILLSHKLQRPEGQWNRKQKTDLIDSLLRKYPINPSYAIKEVGISSVIDGVQRLSCVRDFISDKFALSKDMEPVMINDEEKSLAGLKFSKLMMIPKMQYLVQSCRYMNLLIVLKKMFVKCFVVRMQVNLLMASSFVLFMNLMNLVKLFTLSLLTHLWTNS